MILKQMKTLASLGVVLIGAILEHLDMMLVNLYATSMATHFVGATQGKQAVLLGFLGYSISFLFRPLGAAVFGAMGDVMGRKPSMLVSLLCMSAATLGLGLIPAYSEIGWFATALFVLARITQGMSIGGEYGSALTYTYEISGQRKTTAGALVISATHVGGLTAALLAANFSTDFQFVFQVAGAVGLISLGLRSFLVESHPGKMKRVSLRKIYRSSYHNRAAYRRAFFIASALVFTFYASLVYINESIFQSGLATRPQIFSSNSLILGVWIILPPLLAYCVDQFQLDYRRWMLAGLLGVGLTSAPILYFCSSQQTFGSMFIAQLLLSIQHIVYCFGTPRFLGDQFDEAVRGTGVTLGYSLGSSFTAAVTPLICLGFVSWFGRLEAIAIPMGILSLLAASQIGWPMRELKPNSECEPGFQGG